MNHRIYQAIVDAIPDMIIRISREGVFQSFEGATAELYWPADAYLGRHLRDVLPTDTAALFLEKIDQAFETHQVQYLDYSLNFDGKRRFYESRMIVCSDDEALAIVRNVSAQKATEAELHRYHENLEALVQERTAELVQTEKHLREREALYSAMLEGYEGLLYFIAKDYRIKFMNENLVRFVGHNATGEICYKALHHRQSKCLWCVSDQVFEGQSIRFEMKNPNDKKWYSSVNVPIRMVDGSVYCQSMIRDIDQRKRMEETLRDSEAHLRRENLRLRTTIQQRNKFGDMVGSSPAMQEVYELMLMAAASDASIILYGESGTGKELAASAIHNMSDRRNGRFVPVNCGAIPEALLEREFFGHRKGAFTGAAADKPGYLDEADGGSLFLDEIGEIKPDLQVKLLRAIEGGGYSAIGSNEVRKPNFRIIAATSRNLTELVQKGMMRSDFFYRVHVIPIHLPPLRKRKEDIPLLIEHFLKAYDSKMRPQISDQVMKTLLSHDWPGNVRELQNVLYRFVTLKRLDLTGEIRNGSDLVPVAPPGALADPLHPSAHATLPEATARFEMQLITDSLARCRWNRTRTAKSLGIGLRTLQRKMKSYGIQ